MLKTEDGNDQQLRCTGQAPEANLAFVMEKKSSSKLDIGVLAVGLPLERSVTVQNNGKNAAVFHVEGLPDGVTVFGERGSAP